MILASTEIFFKPGYAVKRKGSIIGLKGLGLRFSNTKRWPLPWLFGGTILGFSILISRDYEILIH